MAPSRLDEEVEALRGLADTQPLAWFCSFPAAHGAWGTKQALDRQPLDGWVDRQMGCRHVQRAK